MEPVQRNEFTYDGTTYALVNGYFNNLGTVGVGNYHWDIILAGNGIEFNTSNRLVSEGEYIYLDLIVTSNECLVAGTLSKVSISG